MSLTSVIDTQHAQPPATPAETTTRIPKIRAHIPSHRIGEPGKVHIRNLFPGLLPPVQPTSWRHYFGLRAS